MQPIFRQLIDNDTKTFTYLLGDPWSRQAVIIDPVREQVERDLAFVEQLGLELTHILDTHVHADHVTGSGQLRSRTGAKVAVSRAAGVDCADLHLDDGDAIRFGLQALEVRATPGHTSGCLTYVTADRGRAFTGDALFVRGCGRTDFQQGDARTLYRSVRDKIFSLPDDTLILPGHDYKGRTSSSVREEKLYNPRLGGKSEDEFVAIMDALDLSYPRKIDVAVPANLRCGQLDEEEIAPFEADASWPLYRTPTGAPAIPGIWVAENRDQARIIDLRPRDERLGPDGRLDHDEHVPMDTLAEAARAWDRDAALVVYCRSGGRSDRAALDLEQLGFKNVASMAGGILKWRAMGLPVTDGAQG